MPTTPILARLEAKLNLRREQGTLRLLSSWLTPPLEQAGGCGSQARSDFASNDYLGFSRAEPLRAAVHALAQDQPLGAGASRLLSGDSELAARVEAELAAAFRSRKALLFNSGYTLNIGLLPALTEPGDCVLMDSLAHASLKNSLKLSAAQGYFFRHNDTKHLESKLARLSARRSGTQQCFVVVESLYSMDGDFAPLAELVALCRSYGAALIVDEAHAVGTCGAWGEGLVAALGLEEQVFARIHTFGKALGCHGAALLGESVLIEALVNFCHSFIYTTALPASSLLAIRLALHKLQHDRSAYRRLQGNIAYFNSRLGRAHPSPIYSFVFPQARQLPEACAALQERGLQVYPIYAPTVPQGQERLRVVLHAFNTHSECEALWEVLKNYESLWRKPFEQQAYFYHGH